MGLKDQAIMALAERVAAQSELLRRQAEKEKNMKPHVREIYQRLLNLGAQVPWQAIEALAETLEEGANNKYRTNALKWRTQSADSHFDKAALHYQLVGDEDSPRTHIAHYITRSLMAGEKRLAQEE